MDVFGSSYTFDPEYRPPIPVSCGLLSQSRHLARSCTLPCCDGPQICCPMSHGHDQSWLNLVSQSACLLAQLEPAFPRKRMRCVNFCMSQESGRKPSIFGRVSPSSSRAPPGAWCWHFGRRRPWSACRLRGRNLLHLIHHGECPGRLSRSCSRRRLSHLSEPSELLDSKPEYN